MQVLRLPRRKHNAAAPAAAGAPPRPRTANAAIEAMTRQGGLGGIALAYACAALLVAGPWIFTVAGLTGLGAGGCADGCAPVAEFRSVVIYNSMLALVATSPIAFYAGRHVAARLHAGQPQDVYPALAVALGLLCAVLAATAVPFYALATTLGPTATMAAVQNAFLIGASWLLLPFARAMRAEVGALAAFAAGAAAMAVAGRFLSEPSAGTLLATFNAGFALSDAILVALVVRRFGSALEDGALGGSGPAAATASKRASWRWELPAAGLAYGVGIWADKVIMWAMAPGGTMTAAGALRTMPAYDTAMFWSQLASIPVAAIAFAHVETRFDQLSEAFYGRLGYGASARELTVAIERLRRFAISSACSLFVALCVVAATMVLLSFAFMRELGLRPAYMGILRASLCAMAFHASAMSCFLFLMRFDLRRQALSVVATYAVLNVALTLALLPLGESLYGFGNMIAAALTFAVAFWLLLRELPWLHYHAFVTNNSSI